MKFCVICLGNTPHGWDGETWVCQVCRHKFSDSISREEYAERFLKKEAEKK